MSTRRDQRFDRGDPARPEFELGLILEHELAPFAGLVGVVGQDMPALRMSCARSFGASCSAATADLCSGSAGAVACGETSGSFCAGASAKMAEAVAANAKNVNRRFLIAVCKWLNSVARLHRAVVRWRRGRLWRRYLVHQEIGRMVVRLLRGFRAWYRQAR